MPFEGAGIADSRWTFKLPSAFKTFDYETIADLVLQIRYTARHDDKLASIVQVALRERLNSFAAFGQSNGGVWRAFSLRHEFPSLWAILGGDQATLGSITLETLHFGALLRNSSLLINEFKAFAVYKATSTGASRPQLRLKYKTGGTQQVINLALDVPLNGSRVAFQRSAVPATANRPTISQAGMPVGLTLTGAVAKGALDDIILCTRVNILS